MLRNTSSRSTIHHRNHDETTHSSRIRKLVAQMSLEDKIGQMSQIDVAMLMKEVQIQSSDNNVNTQTVKQLDVGAVKRWIGEVGVGSVLNLADGGWTAADYRQAMSIIQEIARNYSRPPVIWGLDSVHGANYIYGATIPPQPINMAATFNTTNAYLAGRMASRDTRAAGINWLFSPLLGIALEPRWSRVYETFGEDPVVVGAMAAEMIRGIQEVDTDKNAIPSRAAACAKHFVGYSMPLDGHDRSPAWIPTRHLYQYFVPPWKHAIAQNVMTVMESYSETDGVPNVANRETLQYLLRQRLNFNGVLVTDYEEMQNLHNWHSVANNDSTAVQTSLREGTVDMSMIPWDADGYRGAIVSGVKQHLVSTERLDTSVARVLKLKEDLNMMAETVLPTGDPNIERVGTDKIVGLDMARESIVLTKNEGLLPYPKLISSSSGTTRRPKVLVTGPTASSLIFQSGGWTGLWQGAPNEQDYFSYGSTVLSAFSAEDSWDVSYSCGVDVLGDECEDTESTKGTVVQQIAAWVGLGPEDSIARAVAAAQNSDLVVVCVGEEAYTEKPGDIRSLSLPSEQIALVKALRSQSKADILLVYFGGRPRLLGDIVENVDAILIGFLPGPSAGEAVVDIVSGRVNPSGRLPLSYPKYDDGGGIPYFHAVSDKCTNGDGPLPHYEYVPCGLQWPFGHGMSFTTFEYSNLLATGGIDEDLVVSVTVTNTGEVGGSDAVLFFTFDDFRSTTPEYKRLRAFEKVFLEPGDKKTVTKTIALDDLRFVGPHDDHHYILDPTMTSVVGVGADTDCRLNPDKNPLCSRLQAKQPSRPYVGACEAACDVWMDSNCASSFGLSSTQSCLDMCVPISEYPNSQVNLGNDGWGWGYVNCLESVVWGFHQAGQKECWKMTGLCRNVFQTGQLDEFGRGPGGDTFTNNSMYQSDMSRNVLALMCGLIASAFILHVMKGGRFPLGSKDQVSEDVQFTRVGEHEHEEEIAALT